MPRSWQKKFVTLSKKGVYERLSAEFAWLRYLFSLNFRSLERVAGRVHGYLVLVHVILAMIAAVTWVIYMKTTSCLPIR